MFSGGVAKCVLRAKRFALGFGSRQALGFTGARIVAPAYIGRGAQVREIH
jgi:hypothetical protein